MEFLKVNKKMKILSKSRFIDLDLFELKTNASLTLLITINNPLNLNAINNEILDDLLFVFNYYNNLDAVRSIIITGYGDKAFIAGADIKAMSTYAPNQALEYSLKGQKLVSLIMSSNKPIIAAINGYALGGGCEIAMACHFRYASKNASFGQPEVKLGIIAGWGGTQNLPRLVGYSTALELLLTGDIINSAKAYEIGLLNKVSENNLLVEVFNVCCKINQNSPNAISNTLKSVYEGSGVDINRALSLESDYFKKSFEHKDSTFGFNSFIKKEKPKF